MLAIEKRRERQKGNQQRGKINISNEASLLCLSLFNPILKMARFPATEHHTAEKQRASCPSLAYECITERWELSAIKRCDAKIGERRNCSSHRLLSSFAADLQFRTDIVFSFRFVRCANSSGFKIIMARSKKACHRF